MPDNKPKFPILQDYKPSEVSNPIPRSQVIGEGSRYDENYFIPEGGLSGDVVNKTRAENQGTLMELGTAAANFIPNVALSIAENTAYLADLEDWSNMIQGNATNYGNAVTRILAKQKNPFGEIYEETPGDFNILDSAFWIKGGSSVLESAAAFGLTGYVTGTLLGKTAEAFNKTIRASGALKSGIEGTAQLGTSLSLAYSEGAMTGAQVFEDIYNETFNFKKAELLNQYQGINITPELEQEIDKQAKYFANNVAGESATKAVRINTAFNTLLNMPQIAPLFKSMSTSRVDDELLKRVKGESLDSFKARIKDLNINKELTKEGIKHKLKETGSEGLEEMINVYAEEEGKNVGREAVGKDTKDLADMLASDDIWAAAFWGAVGGAAQSGIINSMPKWVVQEDGTKVRTTIGKYNKESKVKAYENRVNDLTDRITEFIGAKDQLQRASENGDVKAYEEAKNKIFNFTGYNSIVKGTEEALIEEYNAIANLNEEEALKQGFKEDYKQDAREKIASIKEYTKQWNKIQDIYTSQDLDLTGYPETIFNQHINVENNKKIIQKQIQSIAELQKEINESYVIRGTDLTKANLIEKLSTLEALEHDQRTLEIDLENALNIDKFKGAAKKKLLAKYNTEYGSVENAIKNLEEQHRIISENLNDVDTAFQIDKENFIALKNIDGSMSEEEVNDLFERTIIQNSQDIDALAYAKENLKRNQATLQTQESDLIELKGPNGKDKYRKLSKEKADKFDKDTNTQIEEEKKAKDKVARDIEIEDVKTKVIEEPDQVTSTDKDVLTFNEPVIEDDNYYGDGDANIEVLYDNITEVIDGTNKDGDVKDLVTDEPIFADDKLLMAANKLAYGSTYEYKETTSGFIRISNKFNPKSNIQLLTDKFKVGTDLQIRRLKADEFKPYTTDKELTYVNEYGKEILIAAPGMEVTFERLQHPYIYPIGIFDNEGNRVAYLHDTTYIRPERVVDVEGDLKSLIEIRSKITDVPQTIQITSKTNGKFKQLPEYTRLSELTNNKIQFAIAKSTIEVNTSKNSEPLNVLNSQFYIGQVYMIVKTFSGSDIAIPVKSTTLSENPDIKQIILNNVNDYFNNQISSDQFIKNVSKYIYSTNNSQYLTPDGKSFINTAKDKYFVDFKSKDKEGNLLISFGKSGQSKLFINSKSENKEQLIQKLSNILDNVYININFDNIKDNDFVKQYTKSNLPIYDLPDGTYTVFDNPVIGFNSSTLTAPIENKTIEEIKPTSTLEAKKADIKRRRQEGDNKDGSVYKSTTKEKNGLIITNYEAYNKEDGKKYSISGRKLTKEEFLSEYEVDEDTLDLLDGVKQIVIREVRDNKGNLGITIRLKFEEGWMDAEIPALEQPTIEPDSGLSIEEFKVEEVPVSKIQKSNGGIEYEIGLDEDEFDSNASPSANDNIKPGVVELFESNPELAAIGTQEQYSQYLDSIFPDSQVKDIVYHGTDVQFEEFKKGFGNWSDAFWFDFSGSYKQKYQIKNIINMKNPFSYGIFQVHNIIESKFGKEQLNELIKYYKNPSSTFLYVNKDEFEMEGELVESYAVYDSNGTLVKAVKDQAEGDQFVKDNTPEISTVKKEVIELYEEYTTEQNPDVEGGQFIKQEKIKELQTSGFDSIRYHDYLAVFEPEQIHILGSKQDIEGFKEYVSNNKTNTENTLSLQYIQERLILDGKISKYCI